MNERRTVAGAALLGSLLLGLAACTDEEPVTIRGCTLPRLDLVAFAGRGLCAGQDPGGVASGEARAPVAAATWDDPRETDAPELDVGDADAVTVVARCTDDAGVVRLWGCDDDADDRLEIDVGPVCHAGGCELEPGECAAESAPWSGGGPGICVAECDGCETGPCFTGDPLAHGGCDWTCNDPLAPTLVVTAFDLTAPAALAEPGPQGLVDDALADGSLVLLIDVDPDGSFRLGTGECNGPDCAFGAGSIDGEASYEAGAGALVLPANGAVDLALASLVGTTDGLVLRELTLAATVGSDGNCIGARRSGSAWTTAGELRAKITATDAAEVDIESVGASLCDVLAGTSCASGEPQSWPRPPDTDVDGIPAWTLAAGIAAIGVEIR